MLEYKILYFKSYSGLVSQNLYESSVLCYLQEASHKKETKFAIAEIHVFLKFWNQA